MRLEGFAKPISINQQDLQRRFDRWLDKTKGLVQDAADAEERAEKAESLADAAQERMSLKDRVISKLKNTITDLKADLEDHILDPDDVGESVSFKLPGSKEYDPDFELTFMEVLHLTSFRTAWPIMKAVYRGVTGGKTLADEPSRSFLQELIRRADVLADLQIALALTDPEVKSVTVPHDGSTKKGIHLSGDQVLIFGRMFSLGVEAVEDGTAATALESFLRRLKDALDTLGPDADADLRTVLIKLTASLSDRCPVETKWIKLLEERKFTEIKSQFVDMPLHEQREIACVWTLLYGARAVRHDRKSQQAVFARARRAEQPVVHQDGQRRHARALQRLSPSVKVGVSGVCAVQRFLPARRVPWTRVPPLHRSLCGFSQS